MTIVDRKPDIDNQYPIHENIKRRWSPRAFANKAIEDETIFSLLEAARWAPSSFNEQPWRFIYATKGSQDYDKILSSINEFNRSWASKAPVLIVGLAKHTFSQNEKVNRHAWYDLGAAIAHLTFEATSRDIYLHQMAGFSPEAISSSFNVDEDLNPVVALALGYLGEADQLPEKLAERELMPQQRKSLKELIINKL